MLRKPGTTSSRSTPKESVLLIRSFAINKIVQAWHLLLRCGGQVQSGRRDPQTQECGYTDPEYSAASKAALHFLRAVSACSIATGILIPSSSLLALFLYWPINSFAGVTCVAVKAFLASERVRRKVMRSGIQPDGAGETAACAIAQGVQCYLTAAI